MRILFLLTVSIIISLNSLAQVFVGSSAKSLVPNTDMVKVDEKSGSIDYLRFEAGKEISKADFFNFIKKQFRFPENVDYLFINSITDQLGHVHNRYRLTFNGYPVHDGMFLTHEKNGLIYSINGNFPKNLVPTNSINLSESAALNSALSFVGADIYKWQVPVEEKFIKESENNPDATYFPKGEIKLKADKISGELRYTYVFDIYAHKPMSRAFYFVDAQTGKVLFVNNRIMHTDTLGTAATKFSGTQPITTDLQSTTFRLRESGRGNGIQTFNMLTGTNYGNAVDFTDTDNYWNNINSQKDEVATDAHWGMEMTYDYYFNRYNRNSIDGNGFLLKSYVHYDVAYANAFWNGQYMTFGDGNSSWQPLVALDIVGHEISHGLTTFTADLDYQDESGAMNEGYSDIFGTAIEHYGKPASGNWLIGEDIGSAMRSMANPKSKGDPDTYLGQNYYIGTADNGGVHTNSGVLNHWFYLTAMGGQGVNDNNDTFNVTGVGIDTAGAIAFRALTVYLTNTSDYAEGRFYSIQAAQDLYGACSAPVIATTSAFYAVGIGNDFIPGVQADFSSLISTYCAPPAQVVFKNLSNNGQNFVWYFGDGNSSTAVNPVHTYNNYGGYTVKLVAVGGSCGMDSVIKTEYISVDTNNPCFNFIPPNGNLIVNSCKGVVFDDGGLSSYSANSNASITIAPSGASQVKLTFTDFDFEAGYDYLRIYDGANTQATLIGSFDGNSLPNGGVITSTGPALTLVQITDQAVNNDGFIANYECIMPSLPPVPGFAVADSNSCSGVISFIDKSSNGANAWFWDFGDGNTSTAQNPVHTYAQNGVYSVKLVASNIVGQDSVTQSNIVTINKPAVPNAMSQAVCNGGNINLIATNGGVGIVNWYNSAGSASPFFSGDTLVLTGITQTQTYYSDVEVMQPNLQGGKLTNAGGGGNLNTDHGLYFDAYQAFVLHSVDVYANSAGSRTITLKRSNGITIGTKTVNVVNGLNTIVLDFAVPVGTDFLISGKNLYRNNNSVSFPYILKGYLSINRSTAGTDPLNYYYFFYNWQIKQPSCFSERVPITAFVNYAAPVADFSYTINDPFVQFNDNTQNPGITTYNFGDGQSSYLPSPVHLYLQNGNYQVSLHVNNGCGTDTKTKTLQISQATSIDDMLKVQGVKIYPNPTNDLLNIVFEGQNQVDKLNIFDFTGKMIYEAEQLKSQEMTIDVSGFASGVYFIKMILNEEVITLKFVVE